jgi:hypothetical protein
MSAIYDAASGKVGLETENQVIDQINKVLERYQNRLTPDNLWLSERYVKGELRLIFHVKIASKNYVAVLERFSSAGQAESGEPGATVKNPDVGKLGDHCWHANECDEQSMVLVSNVRIVDGPEILALSTLVRFGSANRIYGTLRHALYSSIPLGIVFRGTLTDRESGIPGVGPAIGGNELVGQVVKSASEVVNHVSSDEPDIGRRDLEVSNFEEAISRRRIALGQDYIGVSIDEPIPCDLQITEVLFGPFNL